MENRRLGIKGKPGFHGPSLAFPEAPGGQVAKLGLGTIPSLSRFSTALPEGRES